MSRPPLVTFLTYNRLGNTAIALPSLLRTESEFELYIMDNDSRDDTWQFLQDTIDPRIVHRKRFDHNMGVAHALNYALSHRLEDQAFLNFEADFRIHNKDFIKDFQDMHKEFPEIGAFSATTFPSQLQFIDNAIIQEPERFVIRNGKRLYLDTIMGFCSYFPADIMNIFMYYDEVNCLLDMDIQARFEIMKLQTGYAMDIRVSHTAEGGNCDTCLAYHNPCEQGERKCLKYYSRIISKITTEIGFFELHRIAHERSHGRMGFACPSIFGLEPMTDEEKRGSQKVLDLFKKFTEEKIKAVDEGTND